MRIQLQRAVAALLGVMLAGSVANAETWPFDFSELRSQHYAQVYRAQIQAAYQGNAAAQYEIGVMYQTSRAVPQDFVEAARWYRRAAEQGHARAQYRLGSMYVIGQGVPESFFKAYIWLNLAASHGVPRAAEYRDTVGYSLTARQITEAQRAARIWRPKPPHPIQPGE